MRIKASLVRGRVATPRQFRPGGDLPAVLDGDWDRKKVVPLDSLPLQKAIRELIATGTPNPTYAYAYERRLRRRRYRTAGDPKLRGGQMMQELVQSLQEKGCLETPEWPIRVAIDRDGHFVSLDGGTHRLLIARALDLTIPVSLDGRHAQWEQFRQQVKATGRLYQRLPHPDLAGMGGVYSPGRAGLVTRYASAGAKVLDLGCRYGAHGHLLEEAGFDYTGVEIDPSAIHIAQVVRDSLYRKFQILQAHASSPEGLEMLRAAGALDVDVLLAFNVLRHIRPQRPLLDALTVRQQILYSDRALGTPVEKIAEGLAERFGMTKIRVVMDDAKFRHPRARWRNRRGRAVFLIEK